MRNFVRLGIDLGLVALAGVFALFIRENFVPSIPKIEAALPYVLLSVVSGAVVFIVAQLHRTLWRYTSLVDVLHLMAAVTLALLLAVLASFAFTRLEDVARSLPVIHWLVLIAAMIGVRALVRLWRDRAGVRRMSSSIHTHPQHVLIIGISDLTELYLASIAEFAPANINVVGILSRGRKLHGRLMRQCKVWGKPEDLSRIIAELELHGIAVDRIVVAQPFEQLSKAAQNTLVELERVSAIRVEWLLETLGWHSTESGAREPSNASSEGVIPATPRIDDDKSVSRYGSAKLKRLLDLAAAICLMVVLSPVLALVSLLVAVDVGLPLVFWQQRPGRYGRPFKLYKFRTMRAGHDTHGFRIPDEARFSKVGSILRRSRLDELPQLYNILIGEMSLIGPRPLLSAEQTQAPISRLLARPGLTGWAQVNGGREVSNEEKAALDIWYVMNASLLLDIKILLQTLTFVIFGDRVNGKAVRIACAELQKMGTKPPSGAASRIPIENGPLGAEKAA